MKVDVRLLKIKGSAAVVEYHDGNSQRRVTIPATELDNGQVSKRVLRMGIDYGDTWSSILSGINITPEMLEAALYNNGIFTVDDVLGQPEIAHAAIQNLVSEQYTQLLRIARDYQKGVKNV